MKDNVCFIFSSENTKLYFHSCENIAFLMRFICERKHQVWVHFLS